MVQKLSVLHIHRAMNYNMVLSSGAHSHWERINYKYTEKFLHDCGFDTTDG